MSRLATADINENQTLKLGTSPFKEPTLKTLGVVIVLIWFFSFAVLNRITLVSQESIRSNLNAVLLATEDTLNIWAAERKGDIISLASKPQTVANVLQLLKTLSSPESLKSSEYLKKLRVILQGEIDAHRYRDFFVVSPDYINIASMQDYNIGQKLVLNEKNNFLHKVLAGNTVLSPPMATKASDHGGELSFKEPTMFVATPILDSSGKIIAALFFGIDPHLDFTRSLQLGRMGITGETYAFNAEGRLISDSRFDDQLRKFGIIPPDGHAILTIDIKDPGGNILEGFKPDLPMEKRPLTFMAQQATNKNSGTNVEGYRDYRGVPVVGAWTWNEDLSLGITTEIDKEEAYQLLNTTRSLVLTLLGVTVFLFLGYFITLVRQNKKNILEAQKIRVFSMAVDHSSTPIVITSKEGIILYVNPAFYKLTGYQRDEAVGKTHRILKSGKHSTEFYKELWSTLLAKKSWEGQICNKKKNGELYWEHQVISPIKDDQGNISHFISVKQDDTKRKESIGQLKEKAAEFENNNKKLNEFVNTASHDLQAPLRKVLTFSEHLKKQCASLDDKSRDYIDRMEKSTERMQTLVAGLLDYSKLSSKAIEHSHVDLNEIASEVMDDLELNISEQKAVINIGHLPTLNTVSHQMRQLFQNLILNALKFSQTGTPPIIDISASAKDSGTWEITFKDNGIGLDQKYAERIFNPLERLHGASKYPGTGMGLAICKKIIEQHQGTITVNSEKEKGATFTITLPTNHSKV